MKDESRNPGGSVKDRPALNMILEGERRGLLTPDKIILDSTSGNTGIAYAMIGAAQGLQSEALPAGERIAGAQADSEGVRRGNGTTDAGEGSDGAIRKVPRNLRRRIPTATSIPTSTTIPRTGRRTSRPRASRSSNRPRDASRISWRSMGTSGTFMGVTRRLQQDAARREVLFGAALHRIPRPGRH